MKVTFQLIVYNGEPFLEPCLESVAPFGQVVVAEGPVAYYARKGCMTSRDGTNEVLREWKARGVVIDMAHGPWPEKDDMVRAAAQFIPADTDFVFCVDADEIWPSSVLEAILEELAKGQVDSVAFKPYSFFGGFDRYMTGFEENGADGDGWHRVQRWTPGATWATHRPPTVNAPDGQPWRKYRHWSAEATAALNLRFFHYSYVMPKATKAKTEYYHARNPRGTIPEYFRQVYLPWVLGDDATKEALEAQWQGVHDWLPARRGDCFTRAFDHVHPDAIAVRLDALHAQFDKELRSFR
jgi:glycosyltransferase involved in cell wall biosynthesis